jgi:hypothetical protein
MKLLGRWGREKNVHFSYSKQYALNLVWICYLWYIMTVLTIEIPDTETDEVVKYLKEKHVIIKENTVKGLDDLTIEDYRKDTLVRAKNRRGTAARYL